MFSDEDWDADASTKSVASVSIVKSCFVQICLGSMQQGNGSRATQLLAFNSVKDFYWLYLTRDKSYATSLASNHSMSASIAYHVMFCPLPAIWHQVVSYQLGSHHCKKIVLNVK